MRLFIYLVLIFWLSSVSAASLAASIPGSTPLLTALAVSASRDPTDFHNLLLATLLSLLVATVIGQRRARSPKFCRGNAHDR